MKINFRPFGTLFLCLTFFLGSCSQLPDQKARQSKRDEGLSVDLDEEKGEMAPVPDIYPYDPDDADSIGPRPKKLDEKTKTKGPGPTPIIGLYLGPGLHRTIGYLPLIKRLRQENIDIHILSGAGLGAILAVLLAENKTTSLLEWSFYKFFKQVEEYEVLSDEWKEELFRIFVGNALNKKHLQLLSKTVLLPLGTLQERERRVEFLDKGLIREHLLASLNYNRDSTDRHYSPILHPHFTLKEISKRGADIVIRLEAINDQFTISSMDGYMVGVFGKYRSSLSREGGDHQILTLPFGDMPLDGRRNIPEFVQTVRRQMDDFIAQVKEKIDNWKQRQIKRR